MSRTKCHLFKNQYITCDYRRVLGKLKFLWIRLGEVIVGGG